MTADQVRAAVDPRDAELARLRERNAWLESARVAWRHWRAETKRHAAEHAAEVARLRAKVRLLAARYGRTWDELQDARCEAGNEFCERLFAEHEARVRAVAMVLESAVRLPDGDVRLSAATVAGLQAWARGRDDAADAAAPPPPPCPACGFDRPRAARVGDGAAGARWICDACDLFWTDWAVLPRSGTGAPPAATLNTVPDAPSGAAVRIRALDAEVAARSLGELEALAAALRVLGGACASAGIAFGERRDFDRGETIWTVDAETDALPADVRAALRDLVVAGGCWTSIGTPPELEPTPPSPDLPRPYVWSPGDPAPDCPVCGATAVDGAVLPDAVAWTCRCGRQWETAVPMEPAGLEQITGGWCAACGCVPGDAAARKAALDTRCRAALELARHADGGCFTVCACGCGKHYSCIGCGCHMDWPERHGGRLGGARHRDGCRASPEARAAPRGGGR